MLPRCTPLLMKLSPSRLPLRPSSPFHAGKISRDSTTDHYKALGLGLNASLGEIKKQFYALSKTHHPDHNRNDPGASDRFVKISEAYAVLGNPAKREQYDRDTGRPLGRNPAHVPRGSHSSSGPYGSRPASGLSRRRTQFRGPPPSFYRNGGWGSQGAKRAAQADSTASSFAGAYSQYPASDINKSSTMGPGGPSWINDVPHFDRGRHYRTQEQQEQRRRRRMKGDSIDVGNGGSILINFMVVSGVISVAFLISMAYEKDNLVKRRRDGL